MDHSMIGMPRLKEQSLDTFSIEKLLERDREEDRGHRPGMQKRNAMKNANAVTPAAAQLVLPTASISTCRLLKFAQDGLNATFEVQ